MNREYRFKCADCGTNFALAPIYTLVWVGDRMVCWDCLPDPPKWPNEMPIQDMQLKVPVAELQGWKDRCANYEEEIETLRAALEIATKALKAIQASPYAPAIANDPTGIAMNALSAIEEKLGK